MTNDFLTTEQLEFLNRRIGVIASADDNSPDANWVRVLWAYRVMRESRHDATLLPNAIGLLIETHAWQEYQFQGRMLIHTTFREFVEAEPPNGLGTTVDELVRLCQKEPSVVDMIDQILAGQEPKGRPLKNWTAPTNAYNISINEETRKKAKAGTSLQYSLRKLRSLAQTDTHAAELRDQVLRGDISANRALVLLGKRTSRVGTEMTPEGAARTLKKHLSPKEIQELISLLMSDD
jgi:hypothetical protein